MAVLHVFGRVSVLSGSTGGKRYRVRYTDGLGRRRERTATSEKRAIEIARALDAQLADPDGALQPGVLFAKLVSEWAKDRKGRGWSVRQHDSMMSAARTHVLPALGQRRCDQLTSDLFNKLLASMASDGYSSSAIGAVRQCIRGACTWGVEQNVWSESRNPARGMKLPKGVRSSTASLTEPIDPASVPSQAQVDSFVEAAYDRRFEFGLMVETAAVTGLRFGELAALTKADFDPATRKVQVTKTLVESASAGAFIGLPKSTASRRRVLVAPATAKKLAEHLADRDDDELVFTSARGHRLHHTNVMGREFHPVAKLSGFPDGFTFHSLRHHAITTWVDAGVPAGTVAKAAGHSSIKLTLDRYYGARSDYLDQMRDLGF
jgi:integrase